MKAKKNNAIYNITSDFYLNGPPELIPHLTNPDTVLIPWLCHIYGSPLYFAPSGEG